MVVLRRRYYKTVGVRNGVAKCEHIRRTARLIFILIIERQTQVSDLETPPSDQLSLQRSQDSGRV